MIYFRQDPALQQAEINASRNPSLRPPAGFGESFMQELGMFWRESLSISRDLALSEARSDRAQKIRELAGDEAFIKSITVPGDPRTEELIESLASEHEEIKTASTLMSEIRDRNRVLRQEHDVALQNQTTGGKIGGLLGTMVGALSDPISLGTLPLGASWATRVVKTMLIEAGLGAGIEALIQPAVLRYKQELESPYDLGDALVNIATAGVGASVLTGIVKATARAIGTAAPATKRVAGYDDLLEAAERVPDPTDEQRAAIEILRQQADVLRQSPFDRALPELDDLHLKAMAKASDDLANGRPVDVGEFIEQPAPTGARLRMFDDVEPEEALDIVATRQRVQEMLSAEDVTIRVEAADAVPDSRGELPSVERSAREVLQELDDDIKAAEVIKSCLVGG